MENYFNHLISFSHLVDINLAKTTCVAVVLASLPCSRRPFHLHTGEVEVGDDTHLYEEPAR